MEPRAGSPAYVLGISAFYHDSAAALLADGEVVAAAQEERFSRRKWDASFPGQAVAYCLEEAGIGLEDLQHVAFYEKPWLHFERLLETYLSFAPRGLLSFLKAMPIWLREKAFMRKQIQRALGWDRPVLFTEHHESHQAAAFYPSPFESAAILTVDGVGEWATASWGMGRGSEIEMGAELHFPHSLGLLYSAFTYYLGFRVNDGEYKVMGLAPYGEPRYADLIRDKLVDIREDGSFRLNLEYFTYMTGLTMTGRRFAELFGAPRRSPESALEQKHMDIARSLQLVTEEILLSMARHVHAKTGSKKLVLGGGVALNCVANGRISREGPFEDLWIQPAAGDAGSALGCALAVWHRYLDKPRAPRETGDSQLGSYLGPAYDDETIRTFLDGIGAPYEELQPDEIPTRAAGVIGSEKVLGLFEGRMEFGPRALGNRSIIGDARSASMQTTLNLKIKYRESFRPFAPAVPVERVGDWFDLQGPSPYMLIVAPVAAPRQVDLDEEQQSKTGLERLKVPRSTVPAITHVDCSARVQTVDGPHNGIFYETIKAFEQKTGCPVVINTSFNVRDEPVVCSPPDAYRCFMRTEMDCLIMGSFLLHKPNQPPYEEGDHAQGPS